MKPLAISRCVRSVRIACVRASFAFFVARATSTDAKHRGPRPVSGRGRIFSPFRFRSNPYGRLRSRARNFTESIFVTNPWPDRHRCVSC
jgi:hypothetical protein